MGQGGQSQARAERAFAERARVSAYALKTNASGQWVFAMPRSDVDAPTWDTVTGPAAVAGLWTHVAGVYDATAGQIRLYVNGVKVATAAHTTTWAAAGGLQAGRGFAAGKAAEYLAGNYDEVHAWSAVVSDEALAEFVVQPSIARADRCEIGHWLHAGGPEVKAIASTALAGIDQDRRVAYQTQGVVPHQLDEAADRDFSAYVTLHQNQQTRYQSWEAVLDPYTIFGPDLADFDLAPAYGDEVHKFLIQRGDQTWNDYLVPPAPPKPSQAALDRALAVAAQMRADGVPGAPADWQVKTWTANRIERLLRFGGFPTETPTPDSLEFRTEVEALKINWSDCDPADPDGATGALADVTLTAKREWNAELAAHAAPRNTIVAAEVQAMKDVRAASEAMIEAQGQAWVAGQLLKWQKYWLAQPKTASGYPTAAQFTKANTDLTTARNRINAQLTIAKNASTSAAAQVTKVNTALQQASTIATTNGTPLYRGLAYARQSAQVTKASAAAAQAAAKAIETTLNAAKAAGADGKALQALAATQQAAQQAEFRRAAAEEAAAQAKAAAQAAAARAAHAAEMATKAKNDRIKAEQAEAAAKVAADGAAQKRTVAENERDVASAARDRADAERAKANAAETRAQQDQSRASTALSGARQNEETAADRADDAEQAEERARQARDAAVKAEERRDALTSRARAMEAAAAAAEGTADAGEARAAANAARADANAATSAATSARNNANQATSAAVAARTAAIEADGAATRSRSAANGAQSDANTARSQAATARYAAADAIDAALAAAEDVKAAEVEAKNAQAAALTAAVNAVEARKQADIAQASSARTAAEAWAAAQAATAATAAAVEAVKAGKEAISLGTPYRDTDASAGMAVLVGRTP
ncbi:LamG-like jellyroll fold domain-containing protein [Phytohabitans rumicis]|uniref:LamG-like jellyroll fold domain-containing protein n=1 Tax=Phytohabitans rumicis TaxID=1076125 RepID=UPI001FEAD6F2